MFSAPTVLPRRFVLVLGLAALSVACAQLPGGFQLPAFGPLESTSTSQESHTSSSEVTEEINGRSVRDDDDEDEEDDAPKKKKKSKKSRARAEAEEEEEEADDEAPVAASRSKKKEVGEDIGATCHKNDECSARGLLRGQRRHRLLHQDVQLVVGLPEPLGVQEAGQRAAADLRAGDRPDRIGEGARRARPPRGEPAQERPVRRGERREPAGAPPGERAVRLRARRVHRRADRQARALRGGRRRHAVPRRDRRLSAPPPGQDAPRPARSRGATARRDEEPHGRRAHRRRHAPRPAAGREGAAVPRRPVLPPRGDRGPRAAAARPPRGHPAPRRVLPRSRGPARSSRHHRLLAGGGPAPRRVRVARQRARAGERGGAELGLSRTTLYRKLKQYKLEEKA
jgi:Skp family chaperone for outer membrane proteins